MQGWGEPGRDLAVDEGCQVAQNPAMNLLACISNALVSLNDFWRYVKLPDMIDCTRDFEGQPKVINGCSDLLVGLSGGPGRHGRSSVGMQALPLRIPVEIKMIVAGE